MFFRTAVNAIGNGLSYVGTKWPFATSKKAIKPTSPQPNEIEIAIKNFNTAWKNIITVDKPLAIAATATPLIWHYANASILFLPVIYLALFVYSQTSARSTNIIKFHDELKNLLKIYQERTESGKQFIFDKETLEILKLIAPFIQDVQLLMPKNPESISKRSLEEISEILALPPHKLNTIVMSEQQGSYYGLFKPTKWHEPYVAQAKLDLYGLNMEVKKEDEKTLSAIVPQLVRKI